MMRRIGLMIFFALSACGDGVLPNTNDLVSATAADMTPLDVCDPLSPRATPATVFTLPDAGEAPSVDVLQTATSSIRMTAYEMGYGGIYDTLIAKAKAGVSIEIIFDTSEKSTNQKYFDALAAVGVQCKWSDPQFTYYHNKYFVVDAARAVISTGNWSKTYSIDVERNYVAQVNDANDVANLVTLFDADWHAMSAADVATCTRLVVSPLNAKARILAIIDSAQTSLRIESMQFADTDVRTHVTARAAAGVEVRVILAATSWISANADAATYLAAQNIAPKYITTPHCHVKSIIVDGTHAYMGSENLSYTSLMNNREVGIFVTENDHGAVTGMTQTFDGDWAAATPF